MATEIKMPAPGEGLETVTVLDVKVGPGDVVKVGQALLEIEAEKSTVEVPSPAAGRITKVLIKKGDQAQVGQTLCVLEETEGAKPEEPKKTASRKATESKPPEPARRANESDVKEEAAKERPHAAREAAATAPPSPEPSPSGNGQPHHASPAPTATKPTGGAKVVLAGPATRRLARELGVDLQLVKGSGRGGRLTQEDVKGFVRQLTSGAWGAGPGLVVPKLPDFEKFGPIEKQMLDRVRLLTARQMAQAWSLIPHVTQHDLADITDLEAFRKGQQGKGPKLTVTAFALKASAIALKEYPTFNSSLDLSSNQLILKRYYHIGVAVDTERGLLVPVIRDVDKKSVQEIAQELLDVAERARQGKADMSGSSFTISNLGGIGGTGFTPIVNYPEVAILGLSRSRLEPVVRDGQIVPRLMLPLSLSYDHRVIDGAIAARFTRRLAEMLENPWLMLVQA